MTDYTALGAFAFMFGLIALVLIVGALLHLWNDWAEDRAREQRFADEWVRTHKQRQDRDRYLTDDPHRPE